MEDVYIIQNLIKRGLPVFCSITEPEPDIYEDGSFNGVVAAAHPSSSWGNIVPKDGEIIKMYAVFPFGIDIGETFSVEFEEKNLVTVRPLRLLSSNERYAMYEAEIVSVKNIMSFFEPVTPEIAEQAKEWKKYFYLPDGDYRNPWVETINPRLFRVNSLLGGGDVAYEDYIYTDDLGIDHRIGSYCHSWFVEAHYFGDELLGWHKDFPYRQEGHQWGLMVLK